MIGSGLGRQVSEPLGAVPVGYQATPLRAVRRGIVTLGDHRRATSAIGRPRVAPYGPAGCPERPTVVSQIAVLLVGNYLWHHTLLASFTVRSYWGLRPKAIWGGEDRASEECPPYSREKSGYG